MPWQNFCIQPDMNIKPFEERTISGIGKKLLRKKETIAVAESVTAGLLQAAISQADDAIEFFQGGITTYNLGQKYKLLNVEPIHATRVNSVSDKVSAEMALHVIERFNSDWGIGVTGFATAVPESGGKLFAYYTIARQKKIIAKGKLTAKKMPPLQIQLYYVNKILNAFLNHIEA